MEVKIEVCLTVFFLVCSVQTSKSHCSDLTSYRHPRLNPCAYNYLTFNKAAIHAVTWISNGLGRRKIISNYSGKGILINNDHLDLCL